LLHLGHRVSTLGILPRIESRLRIRLHCQEWICEIPRQYGTASFETARLQIIPRDAVVDTGLQQHVFVATADRFEPRAVTLGARLADRVEVRDGLRTGEQIVTSGVFLLDSESRLRAVGGGTGHDHGTPARQRKSGQAAASDRHEGHQPASSSPAANPHGEDKPTSSGASADRHAGHRE
jgi:hypothetical protein